MGLDSTEKGGGGGVRHIAPGLSVAPELVRVSAFQRRFLRLRLLVIQRSLALVRQSGELARYYRSLLRICKKSTPSKLYVSPETVEKGIIE
jgi:hypothetical protein